MSSSFYRDVAAMVAEAIESLVTYERGTGESGASEAFKSIKNAGHAFLDGDKLKPLIQDTVGIRHEREVTNAALTAAGFSTLTKAPTSHNAPLHNALATLRTHVDRLLEQAEAAEATGPHARSGTKSLSAAFISENRIDALRQLQGTHLDPRKLIRLLEEINLAFENECYMATAALTRAVMDHIPPVFGSASFVQFAASSPKSIKQAMENLQESLRKIADAHLHSPMQAREVIPERQQVVGFQGAVDVLVGEVIRKLSSN
ncbi:MAG: hypothetical protein KF800_00190 [Lysobacter sp.]|nr:hypothetical protein [Xanthomonadaceae bacterium]MBX3710370.1 hypothetical protein [Lysobacter sp.]